MANTVSIDTAVWLVVLFNDISTLLGYLMLNLVFCSCNFMYINILQEIILYSCGPLHMDEQKQDDQLEPIYISSVPIRDAFLKTCRMKWTREKGGEKWSGVSVLMARHDDEEDDEELHAYS